MNNNLLRAIKKLTASPGVYIFKDKKENILYIGKATNLKNRVSSYFSRGADGRPVQHAISKINNLETKETDSVLEALILESNLIKKYQPKYNVDLKDGKSFSYAIITEERYPRVMILRKTDLNENKDIIKYSFGPYTSKKQLETALKIIRKILPYHSNKQKSEKGCLDYQIGLCPGPYASAISRPEYMKNIRDIKMILEGKKKSLVKKLGKEMKNYAMKHEFEKAGETRNKIFALNHIRDIALISKGDDIPHTSLSPGEKESMKSTIRIEAYDISNISGQYAVGSMVVYKDDELDKSQYRKFKIKTIQGADDVGMMKEVLMRRFNNDWPMPDLILLDGGIGHLNMGIGALKSFELNIPIVAVAKGVDRKNIKLQIPNIKQLPNLKFQKNIFEVINSKELIKRIMDEAHRFAIGYHKKIRKKGFIQ